MPSNKSKKDNINIFTKIALLISIFFIAGCKDHGCIEADDYGQYEFQRLTIYANRAANSCEYNSAGDPFGLTISDPLFKKCIFSEGGQIDTIIYKDGTSSVQTVEKIAEKGCKSFTGETFEYCIEDCIKKCQERSLQNSSQASTSWVATDERSEYMNYGVTVEPGSEINIKAIGNIVLDNSVDYGSLFVNPRVSLPNSYTDQNLNVKKFYDIKAGATFNISFYGNTGDLNSGQSSDMTQSFNFAKRLAMYFTPHPEKYQFNLDATDERTGNSGVPLWPDKNTWKCEVDLSAAEESLKCYGDYESNYSNIQSGNIVNNNLINRTYPILASDGSTINQGTYGGIIRTAYTVENPATNTISLAPNDHLKPSLYDPFQNVTCDSGGNCNNLSAIDPNYKVYSTRVGSTRDGFTFTNIYGSAVKLYFKTIAPSGSNCTSFNAPIKILDNSGKQILPDPNSNDSFVNIPVNSNWQSNSSDSYMGSINLEPFQSIQIGNIDENINGVDCGNFLFLKTHPFYDIRFKNSGYVSFRRFVSGSQGGCKILGRIVNKEGSPTSIEMNVKDNFTPVILRPDFYEYSYSSDPFKNPININDSNVWVDTDIFVRKGQTLRIDPASWDSNNYSNGNKSSECGVGYALFIKPKPAILCNGSAPQYERNPACYIEDIVDGNVVGCKAESSTCYSDYDNSCLQTCYDKITCADGTSPNFQKTNCSATEPDVSNDNGSLCTNSQYSNCSACNSARLTMAGNPTKIEYNTSLCVDFENYIGSVSNIFSPNLLKEKKYNENGELVETGATYTIQSYEKIDNEDLSRGARRLGEFNGIYGSFKDIKIDGSVSGYSKIKAATPITFTNSGRLEFFHIEDNIDFNNLNSKYSNNSGFIKVLFDGNTSGTNGDFMEVVLCRENSLGACSSVSMSQDSRVENIIIYDRETSKPLNSTRYNFTDDGYIERNQNLPNSNIDCNEASHGVDTAPFVKFYCHINQYSLKVNGDDSYKDEYKKYRLSFKIYDPENSECEIGDPSNNINNVVDDTKWNGIIIKNGKHAYSENNEGAGQICLPSDGAECKKEFLCVNKYYNNEGRYYVEVRVKTQDKKISKMIGSVINPIIEIIDGNPKTGKTGIVETIYTEIITDPAYRLILKSALIVMITFYGFSYLMGVSSFSNSEIVSKVIKVGIIYFFISENGWYFFDMFVVDLFKRSTDQLAFLMASSFEDSPEISQALANNVYSDKSILFLSVDRVIDLIFTESVQNKIKALLFTSIFGWAYFLLLCYGILIYIYAVANAVLIYLTAQIFMSILFIVGPIFFIFTLFKQTQDMFDNWLKALIGFALQQIFLLTTLGFFNMLIYEIIKLVLNYRICYRPIWVIDILAIKLTILQFWSISSSPPVIAANSEPGLNNSMEDFPSLFSVLYVWAVASLMGKFIEFMTNLATSIGGGISASELSSGVKQGITQAKSSAVNLAKNNRVGRAVSHQISRADQALFDSGKLAKAERARKKAENKKDNADKKALLRAGNKAMSKYKIENASEFANMSDKEKKEKLASVRNQAMGEKAKKLGISADKLEQLKSDKGLKYTGTNAFGAAKAAVFQGSTVRSSINDQESNIKTSLSKKEAEKSLKLKKDNLSDSQKEKLDDLVKNEGKTKDEAMAEIKQEHRDEVMKNFESGNLDIKDTRSQKIKSSIKNATSNAIKGSIKGTANLAIGPVEAVAGAALKAAGTATGLKDVSSLGSKAMSSGINRVTSTAKNAVKSSAQSVSGAAKSATNAAKSIGSAAKSTVNDISYKAGGQKSKDTKEAKQQLINEGKITDRGPANLKSPSSAEKVKEKIKSAAKEFIRPEEETKQISERAKQIREQRDGVSPSKKEGNSQKDISDLKKSAEKMKISDDRKANAENRVINAIKDMANAIRGKSSANKNDNNNQGESQSDGNNEAKNHLKEVNNTKGQIQDLEEKRDKIDEKINGESGLSDDEKQELGNQRNEIQNQLDNQNKKLEKLENDQITQSDEYKNLENENDTQDDDDQKDDDGEDDNGSDDAGSRDQANGNIEQNDQQINPQQNSSAQSNENTNSIEQDNQNDKNNKPNTNNEKPNKD